MNLIYTYIVGIGVPIYYITKLSFLFRLPIHNNCNDNEFLMSTSSKNSRQIRVHKSFNLYLETIFHIFLSETKNSQRCAS